MYKLLHFLGSLLVFFGFVSMMMGDAVGKLIPQPYSEILLEYKWFFLVAGISLSIYGVIGQRKKRIKRNQETGSGKILKSDFIAEQQQHRAVSAIENSKLEKKDLALKVEWTPLSPGGANFKTSKLVQVDHSRLEIVSSTGAYLFAGFFMLMGLGIPGVISYQMFSEKGLTGELFIPILIGSVFAGVGFLMLYFPRPRVFDRRLGWFWAGNKSLDRERDFMHAKLSARLNEVEAIQIISEHVSGSKSSYTSWEINLVSADAKRLNVLDHGDKNSVMNDAELLGDFLGVPVWQNS